MSESNAKKGSLNGKLDKTAARIAKGEADKAKLTEDIKVPPELAPARRGRKHAAEKALLHLVSGVQEIFLVVRALQWCLECLTALRADSSESVSVLGSPAYLQAP